MALCVACRLSGSNRPWQARHSSCDAGCVSPQYGQMRTFAWLVTIASRGVAPVRVLGARVLCELSLCRRHLRMSGLFLIPRLLQTPPWDGRLSCQALDAFVFAVCPAVVEFCPRQCQFQGGEIGVACYPWRDDREFLIALHGQPYPWKAGTDVDDAT